LGGGTVVKIDEWFAVNFLAQGREELADGMNRKRRRTHLFVFLTKLRIFLILNGSKEAK
jgi:hypothetical protein